MCRGGAGLTQFSEDELLDLNRRIIDRLRLMRSARQLVALSHFTVGMRVAFTADDGRTVEGEIVRLNRKTATVCCKSSGHWRVSPALLRPARAHSGIEARCTRPVHDGWPAHPVIDTPMRFEKIWVEQCRATRGITRRFGARSALDLIREKLQAYQEAARHDPGFARELPRFLAAIRRVLNEYELAGYVASRKPAVRRPD